MDVVADRTVDAPVDAPVERGLAVLEPWIPDHLRAIVEARFWAPIEQLTSLDAMVADPDFRIDPGGHIGLYSDHGPNHARDVAIRAVAIAGWACGPLIDERAPERVQLVTGVAVLVSLIHDVGMCVVPPVGRALHAQYAAQLVFSPEFADVLDELVRTDSGRLRTHVERTGVAALAPVATVVAEVLATAAAHSKSTVPISLFDDRASFRAVMQYICRTELTRQLHTTDRHLDDDGTFAWLTDPDHREFADDVIDALRLVRAADALRQRGTTLRTSSGFEIVVDARTGRAVTVLRSTSRRSAYLLEVDRPIVVGEANVRGAEITPDGLRFDFHRGDLATEAAEQAVAGAVAGVVDDVQRDILPTFPRRALGITIVEPSSRPEFADRVRTEFLARRPELADLVDIAPPAPTPTTPPAFDWRRRGRPLDADRRNLVLRRMAEHGTKVVHDPTPMFADALVLHVGAGEVVIAPGEHASFVVVPFEHGLVVEPLGGYRSDAALPWLPVGTIGVLRGHDRNSTVSATHVVEVLVIPDDAFLRYWAEPYGVDELVDRIARRPGP